MGTPRDGQARFPVYTLGERRVDGAIHLLSLTAMSVALPWLLWLGAQRGDWAALSSVVLYACGVVMMLGCSALYNRLKGSPRKELVRKLDRGAIFIMIAGTYSPLAVIVIPEPYGSSLLVFEWALAIPGAALAIAFPRRLEGLFTVLYLVMGWAIVAAWQPLADALGPGLFAMILVGGVVYTVGVGFHSALRLRYHNALWHMCVLVASGCHYVVILSAVTHSG